MSSVARRFAKYIRARTAVVENTTAGVILAEEWKRIACGVCGARAGEMCSSWDSAGGDYEDSRLVECTEPHQMRVSEAVRKALSP